MKHWTAYTGDQYTGEHYAVTYRHAGFIPQFIFADCKAVVIASTFELETRADVDTFCNMVQRAWLDHEVLRSAKTLAQNHTPAAIAERFNTARG